MLPRVRPQPGSLTSAHPALAALVLPALMLLLFGPAAGPAQAQKQIADGVAAVVNGKVITFSEVQQLVAARERSLRQQYTGDQYEEKLKEARLAALRDLIDRTLVVMEFDDNKFQLPEYVVDDSVNRIIREDFGGDKATFLKTLEAQGLTLQKFRTLEREKIIVQLMRQKNVKGDVVVSPQRVQKFYDENKELFSTPAQIKLRMITISKTGGASADLPGGTVDNRKVAEEIRSKIADGADFARMAQMYSEDPNHEAGGDWGWVDTKTLNPELTRIAFDLDPGDVSSIIELGNSLFILYVEAKRPAVVRNLKEVRADVERQLVQEERQKAMDRWLNSLREKAYVKMY